MLHCRIVGIVTQNESLRKRYEVQVDYVTPAGEILPVGVYVYVDARGKQVAIEPVTEQDVPYSRKAVVRASAWWHVSNNWQRKQAAV